MTLPGPAELTSTNSFPHSHMWQFEQILEQVPAMRCWLAPTEWWKHMAIAHQCHTLYIDTHCVTPCVPGRITGPAASVLHAPMHGSHLMSYRIPPTDVCVHTRLWGTLHNVTSNWLVSYASAMFHWITCADVCGLFRDSLRCNIV